jgi:hypothetical protein
MMGLFGSSIDDPKTLGILQLASGLMSSPRFGQGMSQGLLAYGDTMQRAKQQQSLDEMRKLQAEQAKLQMEQTRANMEAQRRQQDFLANIPSPQMAASQAALSGGGGPTLANAANMPEVQPGGGMMFDAMRAGLIPPAEYFKLTQKERPKVKEFKEVRQADGSVKIVGFDEYGKPVDTGQTPFKDQQQVNFGGYLAGRDPITGAFNKWGDVTMNAAQKDDSARGWANVGIGRENLRLKADENNINRTANRTQLINDPVTGPMLVDKGTGRGSPVVGPNGQTVPGEKKVQEQKGAQAVLDLLDEADKYISGATGSYGGALLDEGAKVFGKATGGAVNIGRLKAIEGALLSKMPRMEGPQSNYDVMAYRQAVGQIGDPRIPGEIKKAAVDTVRTLQRKYVGMPDGPAGQWGQPQQPAGNAVDWNSLPR